MRTVKGGEGDGEAKPPTEQLSNEYRNGEHHRQMDRLRTQSTIRGALMQHTTW